MNVAMRRLESETLPPLTLPRIAPCRPRQTDPIPRLTRILCVVAALALPALGITVADLVHGAGDAKAQQAAAPVIPSDGAAAPSGAVTPARATRAHKIAALDRARVWARS